MLKDETTEVIAGGYETPGKTVAYQYDNDGNRKTLNHPDAAYSFDYRYANRNQLGRC